MEFSTVLPADQERYLKQMAREYDAILVDLRQHYQVHRRMAVDFGIRQSQLGGQQRVITLPELPPMSTYERQVAGAISDAILEVLEAEDIPIDAAVLCADQFSEYDMIGAASQHFSAFNLLNQMLWSLEKLLE